MYDYSRDIDVRNTEPPKLLADVAFNKKQFNLESHLSPYDNAEIQVGVDGIEVFLIQGIHEDDLRLTLAAAEGATLGWDPDRLGDLLAGTPDETSEMFKGGLQTALESQVIVFGVKGVSRTCTHQLVRTRKAAFHQQSQRASYMGDWPEVRMPESVYRAGYAVREQWYRAYKACAKAYQMATDEGVSFQDARFILPEGTTNFIMLEYPIREFLNVYAYRACSMFQWEIVHVMRECKRVLTEKHPWMEPHVKISCERTVGNLDGYKDHLDGGQHHCTFQGWERVEGQCDFPWARDTNRAFRSDKHEISPQEAK